MVPLKYLSNFWRALEVPLIHCETNLVLTSSEKQFLVALTVTNQVLKLTTNDAKLYVLVVTLSTQDNVKLFKQLEFGYKIQLTGININIKNWDTKQIFRLLR